MARRQGDSRYSENDYSETVLGCGYGPAVDFEQNSGREDNQFNGGGGDAKFPQMLPRSGSVGTSKPPHLPRSPKASTMYNDYYKEDRY